MSPGNKIPLRSVFTENPVEVVDVTTPVNLAGYKPESPTFKEVIMGTPAAVCVENGSKLNNSLLALIN